MPEKSEAREGAATCFSPATSALASRSKSCCAVCANAVRVASSISLATRQVCPWDAVANAHTARGNIQRANRNNPIIEDSVDYLYYLTLNGNQVHPSQHC